MEQKKIGLVEREVVEGELPPDRKKVLVVGNKIDLDQNGENYQALRDKYGGKLPTIAISAGAGTNPEELKLKVYQTLDIIRVYTKTPSQKPDFNDPIILEKGSTLGEGAASVHKDFAAKMKYARIWGSGKHDGIMAKKDHILQEGDIIELYI